MMWTGSWIYCKILLVHISNDCNFRFIWKAKINFNWYHLLWENELLLIKLNDHDMILYMIIHNQITHETFPTKEHLTRCVSNSIPHTLCSQENISHAVLQREHLTCCAPKRTPHMLCSKENTSHAVLQLTKAPSYSDIMTSNFVHNYIFWTIQTRKT